VAISAARRASRISGSSAGWRIEANNPVASTTAAPYSDFMIGSATSQGRASSSSTPMREGSGGRSFKKAAAARPSSGADRTSPK